MLRKFKISIDGKEYLVEMEEEGGGSPIPIVATPDPGPVESVSVPVHSVEPVRSAPAGGDAILAPMPGTILKILVAPGDSVEANQPVMVLEAMKMENQIVADHAGPVQGIHVSEGQIVNPGDPLITIV